MSGRGRLRGAAAAGLAVLALLIWGLPFPAYETATLLPVETVQLARTEDGRVLLRKSGTEPLLRVMSEASTHELCEEKVDAIIAAMADAGKLVRVK